MLYNVIDLTDNKVLISGTAQEIALWWRCNFETRGRYWWICSYRKNKYGHVDFTQLNLTGKDIYKHLEKTGERSYVDKDGTLKVSSIHEWKTYLRRYQVVDENGRSIDIRSWGKEVWEYEPPRHSWTPGWMGGAKDHSHRISGPSMWRGTFSASMETTDEAELLGDGLPLPIRDNTGVRLPFTPDTSWDYYDKHRFHRKSKSWKDQNKARKQWAKCKRNGKTQRRENDWARLDPDWVAAEDEVPAASGEMKEAA